MFIAAVNPADGTNVPGRKRVQVITSQTASAPVQPVPPHIAAQTTATAQVVAPDVGTLHWKSCLVDGMVACKQCKVPAVIAMSKENRQYWKCTGPGNCQWIGWVNSNQ